MKVISTLLSCLLMAAVTVPYSSAAWSDAPAMPAVTKPSGKPILKKKPVSKAKLASVNKTSKARAWVAPKPKVAVALTPLVPNPYLPDAPGPVPTKPNPYLTNAVAPTPSAVNSYLPLVATTTLALPAAAALSAPTATPTPESAPPSVTPVVTAPPPVIKEISAPAPITVQAEAPSAPPAEPVIMVTPQPVMVVQPPVAVSVPRPVSTPQTYINPYLANTQAFYQAPSTASTYTAPTLPSFSGMPGLPSMPSISPDMDKLWYEIRSFLPDPHMPTLDMDILPSITKVLPTGEKPLYVLTFKCPTELIGITPLPTKALRWLITSGMEAVNSTDLLPFNMQQVCQ